MPDTPPPHQALADSGAPSRHAELEEVVVDRRTAAALVAAFILILLLVPLADAVLPSVVADRTTALGHPLIALLRHPPALAAFTPPVHRAGIALTDPLRDVETAITDLSLVRSWAGALLREGQCDFLGYGNHAVLVGADGWLYYRPGLAHLGGRRIPSATAAGEGALDPRSAITIFARDCAAVGARLIVVMVPDKAAVQYAPLGLPEPASGNGYRNPGLDDLVNDLRAQGILVYLPDMDLRELAARSPAFLHQDSHWTPQGMDRVAEGIAALAASPPPAAGRRWRISESTRSNLGDLTAALRLPPTQAIYSLERVRCEEVADATTGVPWASQAAAPLLLLGDSFTNIYDDPALGWGRSAGLAAHLAVHADCAVEVVAVNGDGINATRSALARNPTLLQGRAAVVWEFAMRDLTLAHWRVIPVASRAGGVGRRTTSTPAPALEPTAAMQVIVTAISRIPTADATLYPDALTTLTVTVLAKQGARAAAGAGEFLLALPCLRRHVTLPAARLQIGDALLVTVIPWETAAAPLMRMKRYDDSGRYDLPLMVAEEWSPAPPSPR